MNHLLRELAPVGESGWAELDAEATERLRTHLAARRLVDWSGPHGWQHSALELGRTVALQAGPDRRQGDGTTLRQRRVLPLAEVRVPFTVARTELDDAERGGRDLEFAALDGAAEQIARLENRAVLHGWSEAGIAGITEANAHPTSTLGTDAEDYPRIVAGAVDTLRRSGIEGPYALVIGPQGHTRIIETTEHGGYLLLDHLRRVMGGGSVVRATGVDGAIVLSLRGGDFLLDTGQDLAIGYSHHDSDTVTCYLEESFTFQVTEPDAAVTLTD